MVLHHNRSAGGAGSGQRRVVAGISGRVWGKFVSKSDRLKIGQSGCRGRVCVCARVCVCVCVGSRHTIRHTNIAGGSTHRPILAPKTTTTDTHTHSHTAACHITHVWAAAWAGRLSVLALYPNHPPSWPRTSPPTRTHSRTHTHRHTHSPRRRRCSRPSHAHFQANLLTYTMSVSVHPPSAASKLRLSLERTS